MGTKQRGIDEFSLILMILPFLLPREFLFMSVAGAEGKPVPGPLKGKEDSLSPGRNKLASFYLWS